MYNTLYLESFLGGWQESRVTKQKIADLDRDRIRPACHSSSHIRDSPPPGTLRTDDGPSLEKDTLRSGGDGMFIPDEDDFNDVCGVFFPFKLICFWKFIDVQRGQQIFAFLSIYHS